LLSQDTLIIDGALIEPQQRCGIGLLLDRQCIAIAQARMNSGSVLMMLNVTFRLMMAKAFASGQQKYGFKQRGFAAAIGTNQHVAGGSVQIDLRKITQI